MTLPAVINLDSMPVEDRRILIIDDEEFVRRVFADCLELRYECHTAASAQEGLKLLAEQPFALVISDVMMPGLSGIELLREVTARYCDTAVIMASGVDSTQRVLDAVRLGVSDYLLKPCDLDVLELSVERALERRALVRAARQAKCDLERRNEELARRQSELERLQMQLVHSEKMASLGGLAAGVAHELNNPAGFIYGNMEIMRECSQNLQKLLALYDDAFDYVPLSEVVKTRIENFKAHINYEETLSDLNSIVDDCQQGAERICDVVQNLRTFSRLDEADYKKVDIHDGLESTLRLIAREFSTHAIEIKRDYAELPLVDCYAGQLNQVWLNLLVNAAHAVAAKLAQNSLAVLDAESNCGADNSASETFSLNMNEQESGVVRITTELEIDGVLVRISDNGCGISPAHQTKIFDPFFTTKPVGEGTGLGLSISYGIIERHHGSIQVESTPDVGTTFTIRVPIEAKRHTVLKTSSNEETHAVDEIEVEAIS